MAVNIDGSTITNKVVYKSDIESLKKVMEDIKKIQRTAQSATAGIASSPRANAETIKKVRDQAVQVAKAETDAYKSTVKAKAGEVADAHVYVYKRISQARAEAMRQSSQNAWNDFFGSNLAGKSARSSASIFSEKFNAEASAEKERLRKAREDRRREATLDRAQILHTNKQEGMRETVRITTDSFNYGAGRIGNVNSENLAKAKAGVNELTAAYQKGMISAREYTVGVRRLLTTLKDETRAARIASREIESVSNNIRNAERNFSFAASRTRIQPQQLSTYKTQLNALSGEYRRGAISLKDYTSGHRNLLTMLKDEAKEVKSVTELFTGYRMAILGITAGAIGGLIHSAVETSRQFQRVHTTIQTAFGPDAAEAIEYTREVSKRLGLDIIDTSKAYSKFAFSAKMAGMSLKDTRDVFESFSEATVAFGMSKHDAELAMLAIEQMTSKGVVQAQELRLQLGQRIPGSVELFAKAFAPDKFAKNPKLAVQALQDAMKKGEVATKDILPKVAKLMNEAFGPSVAKSLYSTDRELSRISNTWKYWQELLMTSGGNNALSRFLDLMNNLLIVTKPLAVLLGGVAQGISDTIYWMQLGVAYLEDWLVSLGVLDYKTDQFKKGSLDTWRSVGVAIGEALGILAGGAILKGIGAIAKAMMGAGAEATGLLGILTKLFGFAGKQIKFAVLIAIATEIANWADEQDKKMMARHEKGQANSAADIFFNAKWKNWGALWGDWAKDKGNKLTNPDTPWSKPGANPFPTLPGPVLPTPQPNLSPSSNNTQLAVQPEPQKVQVTVKVDDGAIPGLVQAKVDNLTSDLLNARVAK